MLISFFATSPRASSTCGAAKSTYPSSERLGVTLVAAEDVGIALPDGRDLREVEISFTLFGRGIGLESVKAQIQPGAAGFLSLICDTRSEPFVHGAVAWDHSPLPYFLFQPGISATFGLEISNVPDGNDWDDPFQWLPGKQSQFVIESLSIESSIPRRGDV